MATTLFPDTKIDEEVVTRKPQGPIDTTIEAVVGTDTYSKAKSNEAARFGDTPGQLIVNPLKTENVFNYGEYYDKFFFEENKGIGTMVAGNGEIIEFDPSLSYEDKISMFNQ